MGIHGVGSGSVMLARCRRYHADPSPAACLPELQPRRSGPLCTNDLDLDLDSRRVRVCENRKGTPLLLIDPPQPIPLQTLGTCSHFAG